MKKTLVMLMALVMLLPLIACGKSDSAAIRKNSQRWEKETKSLEVVHSNRTTNNRGYIARSMIQLKQNNKFVIQGTVSNLSKINNPKNYAYTKATIHVDKVISGDKTLQGKTIYAAVNSGITTTNKWYDNHNQTREANRDILVQYREFPLPKISSKIIVGINRTASDGPTNYYNKVLKQNKFDLKKTYDINMMQYNFWIKNPGEKKYHLNNSQADKELQSNENMKKDIKKLTGELNQKY
ncbi:hypothetical protein [Companilactobacillus crustorum]|uniref:hypothetical protein n=1 Tax=Companilactobacillus crustorum TaxID=392416 RepID=UPI00096A3B2F|nr:hypothetical protein [Companilactobacillus crustorum]WDT66668.1 hypothetical protein NV391_05545 [Companilactobacillus crustorum]